MSGSEMDSERFITCFWVRVALLKTSEVWVYFLHAIDFRVFIATNAIPI